MKTNEDRHVLSAAEVFGRDPSFWQYTVCADIRASSLEKSRQRTDSGMVALHWAF